MLPTSKLQDERRKEVFKNKIMKIGLFCYIVIYNKDSCYGTE